MRGSNPKCINAVQGYSKNSPAYKNVLMKLYENILVDPGNEAYSSYYTKENGNIIPTFIDNYGYYCDPDLTIYPLLGLNQQYQIRYKLKEEKRKKRNFISSRVGLLLGEIKDYRFLKKTVNNLVNLIPQIKSQYNYFIYGYSKTKNLIQSVITPYFPLKETDYSKSLAWGINNQYDEAIDDNCEFICALLDSTNPPNDFRSELRARGGLGVYLEQNSICVSKIHWEIFGSMFPHSFRDFKPRILYQWIKMIYQTFNTVIGNWETSEKFTKKEELFLNVEVKNGIQKIKDYKNKHVI